MIKSVISSMDFFIGARMHAIVVAISLGASCVPKSYVRKFTRLLEILRNNHVLNLENQSTKEVIEGVLVKINNCYELKKSVNAYRKVCELISEETVTASENTLINIKTKSRQVM